MRRKARAAPAGEPSDSPRSYSDILAAEIEQGLGELERPARGLAFSGLSAGLDIGFSVLMMATFLQLAGDQLPHAITELMLGSMYSIGFMFVVLGQSELFTEHTTLAVFPVLAGRANVGQLARLWGLVWSSNVIGGALFAFMAAWLLPGLGLAGSDVFESIAVPLVEVPAGLMLASAVLAGWMMGLLSWLLSAARDTTSRILFVWLVTSAIGFLGLHHCILGTVEVLSAVFSGDAVRMEDFGRFLLYSTLGNAAGGTIFVAVIKYSHVMHPGSEPAET